MRLLNYRYFFSDCFNAKKPAKRGLKTNKSAHPIVVGYVSAIYMSAALGNHSIPITIQRIFGIESVRQGVTKQK